MEAKVKATEEIVEVVYNGFYYESIKDERIFDKSELEIVPKTKDFDYWTRREHQATIAAMQGVLANNDLLMQLLKRAKSGSRITHIAVEFANACAHTFVEKLKESK